MADSHFVVIPGAGEVPDPLDRLVPALLVHLEEANAQPGGSEHGHLERQSQRRNILLPGLGITRALKLGGRHHLNDGLELVFLPTSQLAQLPVRLVLGKIDILALGLASGCLHADFDGRLWEGNPSDHLEGHEGRGKVGLDFHVELAPGSPEGLVPGSHGERQSEVLGIRNRVGKELELPIRGTKCTW